MPFIALQKSTNRRIDITQIKSPRNELSTADMVCPVCGSQMFIKAGMIIRPHFAHKPGRDDCPYAEYARGETEEHRDAKDALRNYLAEHFAEYTSALPELEVYIPEVMHARNRIADVLFTFPYGWRVAHEIQLAAINVQELQERTDDYASVGIDVVWWFGRDAFKQRGNLDWSMKNYADIFAVQILEKEIGNSVELFSSKGANGIAGSLPVARSS